jgi:glycosyltransferase involved in cell wall biosynthesis
MVTTSKGPDGTDIICFGGQDWWYKNRGHVDLQLMRRYAKSHTTLYINSIVMQKPGLGKGKRFIERLIRKTRSILAGLLMSDAGFWVYSPLTLPLHHVPWARKINNILLRSQVRHAIRKLRIKNPIIWVVCPPAADLAIKMNANKMVYLRTDRYEEYPNVDYDIVRKYDQKLKAAADLTLFFSSSLYEEERSQCKNAFFLDHGVDYDMFAMADQNPYKPEEMVGIPKPIVGFFGAIDDHTSDIPFVEKVVSLLAHVSFVFVGNPSSDIIRLKKRKNVWMVGQKPYEQIPHYGKCFDVAIMPWRQNRWIEACNPIKLKEYLALGKPIVSTPFTELQKYLDVVYQTRTPEEFAGCIEKALREDNDELVATRRKKVEKASWDSKAELVLDLLFDNNRAAPWHQLKNSSVIL